MNICLINPPLWYYMGVQYTYNPTVGLPILGAILERAGHMVEIVDAEALRWTPQQVGAYVGLEGFDAVGITSLTLSRKGAAETLAAIRQTVPGIYIVAGGVHPTLYSQEALGWGADCVVTDEAEGNVRQVFESRQKGIVQGQAPDDLDSLPEPAWHLLMLKPINQYPGNSPKLGHPEGIMLWGRGCPSRCRFCGNTIFGGRPWRPRSPVQIVDELQHLRERWGINSVFVYDDELIGMNSHQQAWLQEISGLIRARGLHQGLTIKCQGRCSDRFCDIDTLRALRDMAEQVCVMWGIESWSERVLRAIRKGTTPDMIWHTLFTAKRAGLLNWLFLMVGNLEETADDAELTAAGLQQALRLGLVDYRQVTICSPQPGTEMWEIAERDGWLVEQPLAGAAMHETYAATPWMTAEQMRHYQAALEGMR